MGSLPSPSITSESKVLRPERGQVSLQQQRRSNPTPAPAPRLKKMITYKICARPKKFTECSQVFVGSTSKSNLSSTEGESLLTSRVAFVDENVSKQHAERERRARKGEKPSGQAGGSGSSVCSPTFLSQNELGHLFSSLEQGG